jgi:cytochrome c oxidase assembly protein subunit 15
VMGATVTNTGSAEGCGRSWPLCNGQFVPEFTVATAIEYSHRAVTGVEGVLVLALGLAMLTLRRDREVFAIGVVMLGTLVLQAGLGAAAVLSPQSPFILATHFGISLAAFASTYLAAVVVFERTGGARPASHVSAALPLAVGAYLLVVVYLGAYVRHAGISLACADWPVCNGQLVPALDGTTGVVFAHRLAALGALALLARLAWKARAPAAHAAFGLAVVQALSGAIVVWTRLELFSALAHAAIVALLFAALAHLVRASLSSPERNDFAINVSPPSDGAARRLQPRAAASSHSHVLATTNASVGEHPGRGAVADDGRG